MRTWYIGFPVCSGNGSMCFSDFSRLYDIDDLLTLLDAPNWVELEGNVVTYEMWHGENATAVITYVDGETDALDDLYFNAHINGFSIADLENDLGSWWFYNKEQYNGWQQELENSIA